MANEIVIRNAEFNPRVCAYWLTLGTVAIACTCFGLPLLLIWIPFGLFFTRRYLASMKCQLTNKALKVNKGVLVRVEKTIPLEKITDLGMVQGPILRHFDLHTLTVETAGQSGPGALVSLTGVVDAKAFRKAVLEQRDAQSEALPQVPSDASPDRPAENPILVQIRDSLLRIEAALKNSDRP